VIEIGDIRLHPVSDGRFRLDGGGMFGAVPRAMWEKVTEPDEKNRIQLALNCLLIENGTDVVVVDTGIGGKGDERFNSIYAVDRRPALAESLAGAGYAETDVTMVVCTHLHFDHAGGNTRTGEDGRAVPTFPNARYIVQRTELADAQNPTERTRGSYKAENIAPVADAGLFEVVDGDVEITPGVRVVHTGAHTPGMQTVRVESGGRSAVVASDIIPTTAHLNYPWIAAYDSLPASVLEAKKRLVEEAAEGRTLVFFPHDPAVVCSYLRLVDGKPALADE